MSVCLRLLPTHIILGLQGGSQFTTSHAAVFWFFFGFFFWGWHGEYNGGGWEVTCSARVVRGIRYPYWVSDEDRHILLVVVRGWGAKGKG